MDDARRPRGLWLPALLIWVATLIDIGVAIGSDGVSKAQLLGVALLAFASGLFAAWTLTPPGPRP